MATFYVTAVIGDIVINLPVERKQLGDYKWFEVNVREIYPTIAPITAIAKFDNEWCLSGPRSEMTIDDIQAMGEYIDGLTA